MSWDAIAVTCKTTDHADAVRKELVLRQKRGWLPRDVVLLCVEDPQEGLGSGGATLNALLVVAEHLSAKNELTVVSTDILENTRILIIHLGRYFFHDPCGRAFVSLPVSRSNEEMEDVFTIFDAIYQTVTNQLNSKSPPGLWVCSSDMILTLPSDIDVSHEDFSSGIHCISVPATVEYAMKHGVYKIDEKGSVVDIIYQGTEENVRSCLIESQGDGIAGDMVSLVSGFVFFSTSAAVKLLSLHNNAPVNACTYMGIDSGVDPIQISLYFDILLSMASGVGEDEFVCGKRGSSYGHDSSLKHDKNMELVRSTLWDHLRGTELKAVILRSGKHKYLDVTDTPLQYAELLRNPDVSKFQGFDSTLQSRSFVEDTCVVAKDCMLINSLVSEKSIVEDGSFIAHSHLKSSVKIGRNCVIIGLDGESCELVDKIPDNSFVMGFNMKIAGSGARKIFCCVWNCNKISISDDINSIMNESSVSEKKDKFVLRDDILRTLIGEATPLPPSYLNLLPQDERLNHKTFFTAKLFPVLHARDTIDIQDTLCLLRESVKLKQYQKWKSSWRFSIYDLLEQTDHNAEFTYRRELSVKVSCAKLKQNLIHNKETHIHSLYVLGVNSGMHQMLLAVLDEAALECVSLEKPHLCARVFSCIAEVLALMAGEHAGLRSGPAANKDWKKALLLLEKNQLKDGILALAEIRSHWLHNPDLLIRAARHYERAEHIFIKHACTTVVKFIRTLPGNVLKKGLWLSCECPTRIDLSGGWSDTPPICYENGGSVVNVALLLENERPVGARVKVIKEPMISMTTVIKKDKVSFSNPCYDIEKFRDYCRPQAQDALLKACFVFAGIVSLDSKLSLEEQLLERYGGGLEIQTWSDLPRGSGLGTSSILAGAIITVLLYSGGHVADLDCVMHAVLMVEQLMTTGGGWQDQVGGMVGGIKRCFSKNELPLKIGMKPIAVSKDFLGKFEERLKLIYTGKTRLARNMLQDVLRNWYTKTPKIIKNCKNLVNNALNCEESFLKGDIGAVGECINEYWKQKKIMAPGCEPASCTEIMKVLQPYSLGQTLAGAGGGGFLCVLLKEPQTKEFIYDLVKHIKGAEDLTVYNATVDMTGALISTTSVDD
uniref:L-fucose kinase-like n=1 Tax=Styela clava TaxID=7725 RepID=UPI00193A350F|nr:L-fucose kinase-like [Styela clava]XP_039262134.1 L-fucose kinase-like [Styela clava]